MPGPNLLTPKDIAYRVAQGNATAAIADTAGAAKVELGNIESSVRLPLCVGDLHLGWESVLREVLALAGLRAGANRRDRPRDDPLLARLHQRHRSSIQDGQYIAISGPPEDVGTGWFWHDLRPAHLHSTVTYNRLGEGGLGWPVRAAARSARASSRVARWPTYSALIFGILARWGITSFCAPPTLYRMLVHVTSRGTT